MNKNEIMEIIPHRDPFIFVDEIVEVRTNEDGTVTIVGKKTFTGEEDFFKGHFPGYPIVPGVLLLEAMAQTGAVYALGLEEYRGKTAFFAGADGVKWKRPVLPKDTVLMEVTSLKNRHGICKAEAKAYVLDELVCQAELVTFIR